MRYLPFLLIGLIAGLGGCEPTVDPDSVPDADGGYSVYWLRTNLDSTCSDPSISTDPDVNTLQRVGAFIGGNPQTSGAGELFIDQEAGDPNLSGEFSATSCVLAGRIETDWRLTLSGDCTWEGISYELDLSGEVLVSGTARGCRFFRPTRRSGM